MKLSVRDELRGNRLSLIRAEILSSSGVPDETTGQITFIICVYNIYHTNYVSRPIRVKT